MGKIAMKCKKHPYLPTRHDVCANCRRKCELAGKQPKRDSAAGEASSPRPDIIEDLMEKIAKLETEAITMALRLLAEDADSMSPECQAVMETWRPRCLKLLENGYRQAPGKGDRAAKTMKNKPWE
jgi:hypothetical protein